MRGNWHFMNDRTARIFWPVFLSVLALLGLVAVLMTSEDAREVAGDTLRGLFGFFSTPFIFEASVGLLGIFLLLAINQWRLKKEGDGWVYLVSHEPEAGAAKLPASITQRLQGGVVLQDKPETVDEAGTARANIEGFLELGMAAQASEALEECNDLPNDGATTALRMRVLAANLHTAAARDLLHEGLARFAGQHALFAQSALECAQWIEAHAPRHRDAVEMWESEVRGIGR
jgi:hypothetical protein